MRPLRIIDTWMAMRPLRMIDLKYNFKMARWPLKCIGMPWQWYQWPWGLCCQHLLHGMQWSPTATFFFGHDLLLQWWLIGPSAGAFAQNHGKPYHCESLGRQCVNNMKNLIFWWTNNILIRLIQIKLHDASMTWLGNTCNDYHKTKPWNAIKFEYMK